GLPGERAGRAAAPGADRAAGRDTRVTGRAARALEGIVDRAVAVVVRAVAALGGRGGREGLARAPRVAGVGARHRAAGAERAGASPGAPEHAHHPRAVVGRPVAVVV